MRSRAGNAYGDDGAEPPDVSAFREIVTTELAVSPERWRQDGTVRLADRPSDGTETEEWGTKPGSSVAGSADSSSTAGR